MDIKDKYTEIEELARYIQKKHPGYQFSLILAPPESEEMLTVNNMTDGEMIAKFESILKQYRERN